MTRGEPKDQQLGGHDQLPFVSVFLVLLCMLAALSSLSKPSTASFDTVSTSLRNTFAGTKTAKVAPKAKLDAQSAKAIAVLCKDFAASCTNIESSNAQGTLVSVPQLSFEAAAAGLSANDDAFLQAAATIARRHQLAVAMVVPSKTPASNARYDVLATLLERYTTSAPNLLQSPALSVSSLALLLMPEVP